jgi:hypothetical protein
MTDDQRRSFDNLMLLCPNCHRLVDTLDPAGHPVERLVEIKERHELACAGATWATEAELDRYASLALSVSSAIDPRPTQKPRPRLVVQKGDRDAIEVANVGDADAHDVVVKPANPDSERAILVGDIPPGRISPGSRWVAGHHAPTMGDAGPHSVLVEWTDAAGTRYDGEFPV